MQEKVSFEFSDVATAQLIKLMDCYNFETMGETITHCIGLATDIQIQADEGFTELIVQNPETGARRKLVLPPK